MTQCEMVLKYIEDNGSITPMEAFSYLGITKLATRISEIIRYKGVAIEKETISGYNRFGKLTTYMRYSFPEEG